MVLNLRESFRLLKPDNKWKTNFSHGNGSSIGHNCNSKLNHMNLVSESVEPCCGKLFHAYVKSKRHIYTKEAEFVSPGKKKLLRVWKENSGQTELLGRDSGVERDAWELQYMHCRGTLDPQTRGFGSVSSTPTALLSSVTLQIMHWEQDHSVLPYPSQVLRP